MKKPETAAKAFERWWQVAMQRKGKHAILQIKSAAQCLYRQRYWDATTDDAWVSFMAGVLHARRVRKPVKAGEGR